MDFFCSLFSFNTTTIIQIITKYDTQLTVVSKKSKIKFASTPTKQTESKTHRDNCRLGVLFNGNLTDNLEPVRYTTERKKYREVGSLFLNELVQGRRLCVETSGRQTPLCNFVNFLRFLNQKYVK